MVTNKKGQGYDGFLVNYDLVEHETGWTNLDIMEKQQDYL